MPPYDFRAPRLFVRAPLGPAETVPLDRAQAHYLGTVLRLRPGERVLVFNGRDGEWSAGFQAHKRAATLIVEQNTRPQPPPADLHYLFAPLKAARLDYMVQKAVEMGVSLLQPVLTQHGQVARVSSERMLANAIEAAEQCGLLSLPEIKPLFPLADILAGWNPERRLIFCDEDTEVKDPVAALAELPAAPLALLIGPEGGFSTEERAALLKRPNVVRLSLGPRILRADTAAVAALAVIQAAAGDWRETSARADATPNG
jgi:16S rRNA (uracil1498-N3)-methyltransferase